MWGQYAPDFEINGVHVVSKIFCEDINGRLVNKFIELTYEQAFKYYRLVFSRGLIPPPFHLEKIEITKQDLKWWRNHSPYYEEENIDNVIREIEKISGRRDIQIRYVIGAKNENGDYMTIGGDFALHNMILGLDEKRLRINYPQYFSAGVKKMFDLKEFQKALDNWACRIKTPPKRCQSQANYVYKKADAKRKQSLYIFEMSNGTIKIGITKDVKTRAQNLRTGSGLEILRRCYTSEKVVDAKIIESKLHKRFFADRTIGEFFTTNFEVARDALKADFEIVEEITL